MSTQQAPWGSAIALVMPICAAAAPLTQLSLCVGSLLAVLSFAPPSHEPRLLLQQPPASVFVFARVMDDSFNASELPLTADLMADVSEQAIAAVHSTAKQTGLQPDANAVRVSAWAELLSNIYIDRREALVGFGHELAGESRARPEEIAAGQKLGADLARQLLADRLFRWRFEAAKDECQD